MDSFTILINGAKTFNTLKKFIEEGGIERTLGDLEMDAAKEALRKRGSAIDKGSQVWSAVTHLESSYLAYLKAFAKYNTVHAISHQTRARYKELFSKAVFSLCLMSVCYKYLGEERLCVEQIDKALQLYQSEELNSFESLNEISGYTKAGMVILFEIPIVLAKRALGFKVDYLDIEEESVRQLKTNIQEY